jgi:hypothetical protein
MMRSGGGLIMVLAWVNNLFIQQLVPLNVDPIAIKVNGCYKTTCCGLFSDMQSTTKSILFMQGLPENLNDDSFIDTRYPS